MGLRIESVANFPVHQNQKVVPNNLMLETQITASLLVKRLLEQNVTHVVTLPDSETKFMYDSISAQPGIDLVPICREGEAIPIAAGLWVAGKRPIVLIQNAGLFESGDALRGLALGINLPLVMFIGYRGFSRHGDTPDTAAQQLEPFLHTWRVGYYIIESDRDLGLIPMAFDNVRETNKPFAVLVGAEYGEG